MKFPFFPKISAWLRCGKRLPERRGALTLISAFMFFVFATLGLSMLYFSQIYTKLGGFKINSTLLDYASENGIKQGFLRLSDLVSQNPCLILLTDAEFTALQTDTENQGTGLVDILLNTKFPYYYSHAWDRFQWQGAITFAFMQIKKKENYFEAAFQSEIAVQGRIRNFKPARNSAMEGLLCARAGNIPLSTFPLLIDAGLPYDQIQKFLSQNHIEFTAASSSPFPPVQAVSGEGLVPKDAAPLIKKALKTKIFHPQDLSPAKLRQILGLDISDEPIPEGVYLIQDDLGLGGIFVQGDVTEMVLAIEQDFQVVSFAMEQERWILRYSPETSQTFFLSPHESRIFDLVPLGIIIVDGKISSLGGGVVEPSGDIRLIQDREIPCIRRGIDLTIISSDKITLSSHLIHQGVKWQDGVAYAKDSSSQLNIFATGSSILGKDSGEGKIEVAESAPQEIKIQGSLTASEEGFVIQGEKKTVNLLGSLHTTLYQANRNDLRISIDDRHLRDNPFLQNAPQTAHPVLALTSFTITNWKENLYLP